MKTKTLKLKNIIWFALQVLMVFTFTQFSSYRFGHFSPTKIAYFLPGSAFLLFIVVFAVANNRDRKPIEQIVPKH